MKSFEEVWNAMEARQRQYAAGDLPFRHAAGLARQALRHAHGWPTAEALCGFADGQLWKMQRWLWVTVWWHVVMQSCSYCSQEMAELFLEESTGSIWAALCARRMDQRRHAWMSMRVVACAAVLL